MYFKNFFHKYSKISIFYETNSGLLVFESFSKRRTPGVCGAMSKMFVGGC